MPSKATNSVMTAPIKGVDSKLAALILDEIVDGGAGVSFNDIAGLSVISFSFSYQFGTGMLSCNSFTVSEASATRNRHSSYAATRAFYGASGTRSWSPAIWSTR